METKEMNQKSWQCLEYASKMYGDATGFYSSGNDNSREFFNNAPPEAIHMHITAPSVAIWFNNDTGHAGFVSSIDSDGTIHYTDANYDPKYNPGAVRWKTFSDPYYLGKLFPNFKGYVTL